MQILRIRSIVHDFLWGTRLRPRGLFAAEPAAGGQPEKSGGPSEDQQTDKDTIERVDKQDLVTRAAPASAQDDVARELGVLAPGTVQEPPSARRVEADFE